MEKSLLRKTKLSDIIKKREEEKLQKSLSPPKPAEE